MKYASRSTILLRVASKSWEHSAVELPRNCYQNFLPEPYVSFEEKNSWPNIPQEWAWIRTRRRSCITKWLYFQYTVYAHIRQPLKGHSLMAPPNRRGMTCPLGAIMNSAVSVAILNYARFESFSFSSTRRTNIGLEYLHNIFLIKYIKLILILFTVDLLLVKRFFYKTKSLLNKIDSVYIWCKYNIQ